ncbi:MAG: hypothetical protein IKU24_05415, partial [Clostridia bacterium]|nr:hypothetical protein [Clostridia bacterium]
EGLVMTDWWVYSDLASEIRAGSDVKMPHWCTKDKLEEPDPKNPAQLLQDGEISMDMIRSVAKHMATMMDILE